MDKTPQFFKDKTPLFVKDKTPLFLKDKTPLFLMYEYERHCSYKMPWFFLWTKPTVLNEQSATVPKG